MPKTRRSGRRNAAVLRARALRRDLSLPEGLLWQILRTRPGDLKWRHQHSFERCTADFYCPAVRLVVEVDAISTREAMRRAKMRVGTPGCGARVSASCASTLRTC